MVPAEKAATGLETRLSRIGSELLSFGPDHGENIHRLTALAGELLGATCVLYNCIEDGLLCTRSSWMLPKGYNPKDRPEGHICYDVIRKGGDDVFVARFLDDTEYSVTDPNVRKYNLKTYMGKAVKFGGVYLGSLCAVYQHDFAPDEQDKTCLRMLASLAGIEEDRRREYEKRLKIESQFSSYVENQEDSVCRWTPEMIITFVNKRYAETFGGDCQNLLGQRWIDIVPEKEREHMEDMYSHLISNPKVSAMEHAVTRADGSIGLFRWINIPITNIDGGLIEFQSIGRDITEKKA